MFNKPEKTPLKKIWLPILIAIVDLAIIILLVILFKNALAIVAVVVLGHLIFLVYLAKTLEMEKISKDKEIKARLEAEQKIKQHKQELEKERRLRLEAEKKVEQPQQENILISHITNFEDLKKYVFVTLKMKFSAQEIKQALLNVGWPEEKIEQAFKEVLKIR